jgi:uncharacterized protein YkwD
MGSPTMSVTPRRLLPLVLAGSLLASIVPGVTAAGMTIAQAESYLVRLINDQRAALSLVPVRIDTRVRSIARTRSADMDRYDYFGHQNSDGRMAWEMMSDAGITWYGAGEIIAMNSWGTLQESAQAASRGWRNSPPHYAILASDDLNYVGIGYDWDASRQGHLWTAVFMRGPDRTSARSLMNTGYDIASGTSTATVSWRGWDPRLQVLTAGLGSFALQRRVDGGSWQTIWSATTRKSWSGALTKGRLYEFRVRARDRAGNYGVWSKPIRVRP